MYVACSQMQALKDSIRHSHDETTVEQACQSIGRLSGAFSVDRYASAFMRLHGLELVVSPDLGFSDAAQQTAFSDKGIFLQLVLFTGLWGVPIMAVAANVVRAGLLVAFLEVGIDMCISLFSCARLMNHHDASFTVVYLRFPCFISFSDHCASSLPVPLTPALHSCSRCL